MRESGESTPTFSVYEDKLCHATTQRPRVAPARSVYASTPLGLEKRLCVLRTVRRSVYYVRTCVEVVRVHSPTRAPLPPTIWTLPRRRTSQVAPPMCALDPRWIGAGRGKGFAKIPGSCKRSKVCVCVRTGDFVFHGQFSNPYCARCKFANQEPLGGKSGHT